MYEKRVYNGYNKATGEDLVYGPNIKDWPEMSPLADNILLKVCSKIMDPVTTTDELIPSGETSSFRSNPLGLAEFTLSRRDPEYVGRSKAVDVLEKSRVAGDDVLAKEPELTGIFETIKTIPGQEDLDIPATEIGSMVYAVKPGDGSAREQAASCQKVLGGFANICYEYATKRYRSNCINWGILPFTLEEGTEFPYEDGDFVFVPGIRAAIESGQEKFPAKVIRKDGSVSDIDLYVKGLTDDEKTIILEGCLMNYYAAQNR